MLTVSDNHIVLGGGGGGGSSTFAGLSDKATADIPGTNTPLANALGDKEATSNKKTDVDAHKTSDTFFPSIKAVFDWVSGLFVKGAVSSTDNAIARFDGTTGKLVKNSGLVITDSGFLGIGVTAPVTQLHVEGAKAGIILHRSGGDEPFIRLSSPADITGFGGQLRGLGTGKGLRFTNPVSDVEWMRIDGVGNVSIGTATATAKMDVNGTSRFRSSATFDGKIIDNAGSSGTDGQVLKKVGGLVLWANP